MWTRPWSADSVSASQAAIHGDNENAAAYHGFPGVKAFMDALRVFGKT
ncbi:hypothetical protein [Thioalkalivibrio thiocyanodenitrificans]|nr:hypothetical protein [Thioalkalivibrio thiocyanodenitrificans]